MQNIGEDLVGERMLMRWINFRRIAISLAFAIVAAVLLVSINEASYKRSTKALEAMTQTQNTRSEISQLLRLMLDAETGLRGYLLTGEERYLEPYSKAIPPSTTTLTSCARSSSTTRRSWRSSPPWPPRSDAR